MKFPERFFLQMKSFGILCLPGSFLPLVLKGDFTISESIPDRIEERSPAGQKLI
jgi:hypothetical protein